jgi:hypothetical protein
MADLKKGTKPTVKKISWAALVAAATKNKDKKEVEYQFSNGRKFHRRNP